MRILNYKASLIKAAALLFLITLLFNPLASVAAPDQGDLPCYGTDPYSECPLDNGVIACVVIAVVFGAYQVLKNKRAQDALRS